MSVSPGDLVSLKGLQSETGKKMNGKTAAVLKAVEDGRFQLRVKGDSGSHTVAIKPDNMTLKSKRERPAQDDMRRGVVVGETGDQRAEKLVDLLVRPEDGYNPSEIMLMGEASSRFMKLDQYNFMTFCAYQMEQLGGMCGLTAMCQEGEAESVLFALLNAHTMSLDCILLMIYQTPLIAPDGVFDQMTRAEQASYDTWTVESFTADQDRSCYIKALSQGPLGLLDEMAKYQFGGALFAAIRKTRFWFRLVRRLMRIIAREKQGTPDGVKLGKMCRRIMVQLCAEELDDEVVEGLGKGPVHAKVAASLLEREKLLESAEDVPLYLNLSFKILEMF